MNNVQSYRAMSRKHRAHARGMTLMARGYVHLLRSALAEHQTTDSRIESFLHYLDLIASYRAFASASRLHARTNAALAAREEGRSCAAA